MIIGEDSLAIKRSFYEAIDNLSSPSDCLPVNYWERIYSNVLCRVHAEQELRLF